MQSELLGTEVSAVSIGQNPQVQEAVAETTTRETPQPRMTSEIAHSLLEFVNSETLRCNSHGLSGGRMNSPVCRAGLASCSFNLPATLQRTALSRAEPSTSTDNTNRI